MHWNLHHLPPIVRQQVLAQYPDLATIHRPPTLPGSPGQERLTQALLEAFGRRVQVEYRPLPDRRYRVDAAIPDAKLAIEINGWSNHGKSLSKFQSDHRRTRALLLAGWRVLPFTHKEALHETAQCVAMVRELVARGF
jgi:very-short-patch-repair endonuclease